MQPLFSIEQIKEADRYTIREIGISELVLMEHAGLSVVKRLIRHYKNSLPSTKGVILVGNGNNGGDALVAARILYQKWCRNIIVSLLSPEQELSQSPSLQLSILKKLGLKWTRGISAEVVREANWIIDGIFGTGLKRDIEGTLKTTFELINRLSTRKLVISIDIPSGLMADTGNPLGAAIKATETVTLGFIKKGLVTGRAADYVGRVYLRTIQIPRLIPSIKPEAFLYESIDTIHMPDRRPSGHKGEYGHVYVVSGSPETEGAALLACVAAMRSGAGLVTLLADKDRIEPLRARMPVEIMTMEWNNKVFHESKGTIVIGPGLGKSEVSWQKLVTVLESNWNVIVDADGLNLFSERKNEAINLLKARIGFTTVLTPHPGEAGRLLNLSTELVQSDRYEAAKKLVNIWNTFIVLKGKGTIIAAPRKPSIVVTTGDTSLSKGGSGDVLTGIIAALIACNIEPIRSLPLATYVHGRAAEILSSELGQTQSSFAGEIAGFVPKVFAEIAWRKKKTLVY